MFRKFIPFFFLCITLLTACNSDKNVSGSLFLMDTLWNISVSDSRSYEEICTVLKNADSAFDSHSENGEVYSLNANGSADCSEYLCELVSNAVKLSDEYSQRVSISCGTLTDLWRNAEKFPDEIQINNALSATGNNNILIDENTITLLNGCKLDTGAFAKGYALGLCRNILEKNNADYAVISSVSSILLYGEKSDGEPFKVQIKNPKGDAIIGTASTTRDFVSTSGGYERFFTVDGKEYCHIIDTYSGTPSESDLASVTVFCDSSILSDYLSTLIFAEGSENIYKYLDSENYEIAAFDKKGESYISKGLDFLYEK